MFRELFLVIRLFLLSFFVSPFGFIPRAFRLGRTALQALAVPFSRLLLLCIVPTLWATICILSPFVPFASFVFPFLSLCYTICLLLNLLLLACVRYPAGTSYSNNVPLGAPEVPAEIP